MTQTKLVEHLARRLELTQTETYALLKAAIDEWTDRLAQEETFSIPGLGTFRTEIQDTRSLYSPHHDQMLLLPPSVKVHFGPSQALKVAVNDHEDSA